jgi:RNA polymerase sigma-70 factor (ECF subfamily)
MDSPFDLRQLWQSHRARVWVQALRQLNDREDAADVVQDVFLAFFSMLPRYRGEAKLQSWLDTTTRKLCSSKNRLSRRGMRVPQGEVMAEDPPDETPGPEEALIQSDSADRLKSLIGKLPSQQARAIVLHYYDEKPYAEIARELNIPVGTVGSLISRGRDRLHTFLFYERESL